MWLHFLVLPDAFVLRQVAGSVQRIRDLDDLRLSKLFVANRTVCLLLGLGHLLALNVQILAGDVVELLGGEFDEPSLGFPDLLQPIFVRN